MESLRIASTRLNTKKNARLRRAQNVLLLLKVGSKKFRSLRSAFFFWVCSGADTLGIDSEDRDLSIGEVSAPMDATNKSYGRFKLSFFETIWDTPKLHFFLSTFLLCGPTPNRPPHRPSPPPDPETHQNEGCVGRTSSSKPYFFAKNKHQKRGLQKTQP